MRDDGGVAPCAKMPDCNQRRVKKKIVKEACCRVFFCRHRSGVACPASAPLPFLITSFTFLFSKSFVAKVWRSLLVVFDWP